MKLIYPSILVCLALLYSSNAIAETISKKYGGESSVTCGGKTYPIPTYFPGMKEQDNKGFYLAATCKDENIYVGLNIGKDCKGEHMCSFASFFTEKNSGAAGLLSALTFDNKNKEVNVGLNTTGTIIPSKCYAYCNETQLFWFDHDVDHITVIGTKNPHNDEAVIKDLQKSAKSYLSNPLHRAKP